MCTSFKSQLPLEFVLPFLTYSTYYLLKVKSQLARQLTWKKYIISSYLSWSQNSFSFSPKFIGSNTIIFPFRFNFAKEKYWPSFSSSSSDLFDYCFIPSPTIILLSNDLFFLLFRHLSTIPLRSLRPLHANHLTLKFYGVTACVWLKE